MSTYDVRSEKEEISVIIFGEESCPVTGNTQAMQLEKFYYEKSCVKISDIDNEDNSDEGMVLVTSKEHAENLIKALEKAISLGWLK